jgi:hypothetical protein
MKNKSQFWTLDLVTGVTVFMILMVSYFIFTNNISQYNEVEIDGLYDDIAIVSSSLITEGSPDNWDIDSVKELGITEGKHRLNITKLQRLSTLEYPRRKLLLKTRYEYLIFFENKSNEVMEIGGIEYVGKAGLTRDNIEETEKPKNLVSTRRFLIHDNDIITMVVYLW